VQARCSRPAKQHQAQDSSQVLLREVHWAYGGYEEFYYELTCLR
jgi:hypothetical protein